MPEEKKEETKHERYTALKPVDSTPRNGSMKRLFKKLKGDYPFNGTFWQKIQGGWNKLASPFRIYADEEGDKAERYCDGIIFVAPSPEYFMTPNDVEFVEREAGQITPLKITVDEKELKALGISPGMRQMLVNEIKKAHELENSLLPKSKWASPFILAIILCGAMLISAYLISSSGNNLAGGVSALHGDIQILNEKFENLTKILASPAPEQVGQGSTTFRY